MSQTSIIFLDRDPTIFQSIGANLQDESTECIRVEKTTDAVRLVQNKPNCLLIVDASSCNLPIEEIVTIIRAISKDIPIIVTTEKNSTDLEKQVRSQSIFYYHIKSFGDSDLDLAVRNALQNRRSKHSGS